MKQWRHRHLLENWLLCSRAVTRNIPNENRYKLVIERGRCISGKNTYKLVIY